MRVKIEETINKRIQELGEQLSLIKEARISGITENDVLTRINELERLKVTLNSLS